MASWAQLQLSGNFINDLIKQPVAQAQLLFSVYNHVMPNEGLFKYRSSM